MEKISDNNADLAILIRELLALRISREATIRQMQRLLLDYPQEEVVALITERALHLYDAYESRVMPE